MGRRVVITGSGIISPLGDSAAALYEALAAGRSGLVPLSLFAPDGMPRLRVGEITGFDAQAYLGEGNLRPLDRISRLVVVAAQRALAASGWTAQRALAQTPDTEIGLVLGTMWSGMHTIADFDRRGQTRGPAYASPLDFANSVLNAAAGQTAIWHDLRGVNSTVSGSATAGLQAIAQAADLIGDGRANVLLAGGAEELCPETLLGFHAAGMLCGEGELPLPGDPRSRGFALSEGAALVVLEAAETAAARGAPVLAEVAGHGSAFDARRGADPAHAGQVVARAILQALADAQIAPADVDVLYAAANGDPRGDAAEAAGLAAVFGAGGAGRPVVYTKGLLGEALGAGAAFQVVAALAEGREVRHAVIDSMGFDGQHAALVLARPEEGLR